MKPQRTMPVGARRLQRTTQRVGAMIGALALALVAAGCATTSGEWEAGPSKEYRTGSNLPVRDRSASETKSYDPRSVQDAVRSAPPPRPAGLQGG